jgi:hypothetical protein
MPPLEQQLQDALRSPELHAEAEDRLRRARDLGMNSDWAHDAKELEFARMVAAAHQVLPPGGSIETGVLAGGTSSLLILSCAPDSFHLSIDPYGLPDQEYWDSSKPGDREAWPLARRTIRGLHELADERGVNYAHYLMGSETFVQSDLLRHPGGFNVVHLDGDHSFPTVAAELSYFTRKLTQPAVFLMDDHDDVNPGVGLALEGFRRAMTELFHKDYDLGDGVRFGFSAWLHPGADTGGRRWWRQPGRR